MRDLLTEAQRRKAAHVGTRRLARRTHRKGVANETRVAEQMARRAWTARQHRVEVRGGLLIQTTHVVSDASLARNQGWKQGFHLLTKARQIRIVQ